MKKNTEIKIFLSHSLISSLIKVLKDDFFKMVGNLCLNSVLLEDDKGQCFFMGQSDFDLLVSEHYKDKTGFLFYRYEEPDTYGIMYRMDRII